MAKPPSKQANKSFSKEIKYLLYLPKGYKSDAKRIWPLLVFLHGAGERGDDLELVKLHGPPKLIEAGKKMPFIVASPQLAEGEWWSPDLVALLTKDIIKTLQVDEDRVYLTGLSMGGYGTWDTIAKYPELFAAISPICGRGDPSSAWKLRHIPTWIFHGARDPIVPIKHSDDMNLALKQYGKVKYTIYPEAEHDSWTETYNNDELYEWFLSHRKFKYIDLPLVKPERYVGVYSSDENSAEIFLKNEKLCIGLETSNDKEMPMKPFATDSFVFSDYNYEFVFKPDGKSGYGSAMLYERRAYSLKKE